MSPFCNEVISQTREVGVRARATCQGVLINNVSNQNLPQLEYNKLYCPTKLENN